MRWTNPVTGKYSRSTDELLPQAYEILLNADSVTAVADTLAKYLDRHRGRLGFSKMNR